MYRKPSLRKVFNSPTEMLIIETTYNEQEKVWQGAENQVFIDPLITIGDVVLDALKENGGKPFEVV